MHQTMEQLRQQLDEMRVEALATSVNVPRAFTVYLSGPIANCSDVETVRWRDYVKTSLGNRCRFLDPVERVFNGTNGEEIVYGDKEDIFNSDLIFVNAWKMSVGTSMEIMLAHMLCKNIVVVCPPDANTENGVTHPWVSAHATQLFHTLSGGVDYLRAMDMRPRDYEPLGIPFSFNNTMGAQNLMLLVHTVLQQCHLANRQWWPGCEYDVTKTATPKGGEGIGLHCALIMSEVSEALEHYRKKNAADDKLPQYPGFPVELMDAIIRIGDLLGGQRLNRIAASSFVAKSVYNSKRADHKPEYRKNAADGKDF